MQTIYLDDIDSTQRYLLDELKSKNLVAPCCVMATSQSDGKGSRANEWKSIDGNFFISFAINKSELPIDLKLESSSIYFAQILKDILSKKGSKIWLKWPNDFYIDGAKIGGVITNVYRDTLVCGIGLNTTNAPKNFEKLDIEIENRVLLKIYINRLKEKKMWKHTFSNYLLEFEKSKSFITHNNSEEISLKNATLNSDGSIEANGQRIYSLR
ncbi:MAG: biotin--[acetyl-CoA-carboxylase] ligase [Campylobacterota bacterium]|nr:biotin--[acetyl-CoA-carboxylase] ligase [Campylobacterota bacterium]